MRQTQRRAAARALVVEPAFDPPGARLPEALQRVSWIYELYRLGTIIGLASERRRIQRDVLEQIVQGVGATSGSLALIDDERRELFVAACVGLPEEVVGQPLDLDAGVLGRVAREGEPLLLIGDLRRDRRFRLSAQARRTRPASAIVWPLKYHGKVTGILSVNRAEPDAPFTRTDLEHGQALLNLVTVAIENTRLQEEQHKRIEELSRMNEELRTMHRRLDEARARVMQSEQMAALGRLSAGVAHEINNPLAYIASNMGTLKNYLRKLFALASAGHVEREASAAPHADIDPAALEHEIRTMVAEVEEGVDRVKRIVRELRLFSHSGSAEWERIDLNQALDSAIKFARPTIGEGITIEKVYGAIPHVECVPAQIKQVVLNLLGNAAHAMADGGTIGIATGLEGNSVWIAVSDTGAGIREEDLSRIFEPFFTTKDPGQGTGLGLSLSYGIVRRHCGSIEVTSAPGQGSTFTVWLPVCRSEEPAVRA
jgi:two-component system, NtrC family, sensor kinase